MREYVVAVVMLIARFAVRRSAAHPTTAKMKDRNTQAA